MLGWRRNRKHVTIAPSEALDLGLIDHYKAYMLEQLRAHPELEELEGVDLQGNKLYLRGPREGWAEPAEAKQLAGEYTNKWVAERLPILRLTYTF